MEIIIKNEKFIIYLILYFYYISLIVFFYNKIGNKTIYVKYITLNTKRHYLNVKMNYYIYSYK